MKITLALAALAAVPAAQGGSVATCAEQDPCIRWEMKKLETSEQRCETGQDCVVEVCFYVNNQSVNPSCSKTDSFSHACDAAGIDGCPDYTSTGQPITDTGDDANCDYDSAEFLADGADHKCDESTSFKMCQEGYPGQVLYFILKDGRDTDQLQDNYTASAVTIFSNVTNDEVIDDCTPTITCSNNEHFCGDKDKNNSKKNKERTWEFTIPSDCGICEDTAGPTYAPTGPRSPTPGGASGDPHFKTWKNEHFEYHGQCDLVLAKDANFADGLGLDIQIRTKVVRFWSYIKQAAIRIGGDILEVEGTPDATAEKTNYWYNLQYRGEMKTLGGFPITESLRCPTCAWKALFEVDLSSKYPGAKIVIGTYKEFVKVEFEGATAEAFGNVVGMLGDFNTGKTLARDGATELNDFHQLGNEWQVLPVEDILFHDTAKPQFPEKCIEPEDPQGQRRRRLDESSINEEQAEKACAHLNDALDRKDCVYDILATQDLDMVGAY